MAQLTLHLILDREMLLKVAGYYLYRSEEQLYGRPVVDGVYIQRSTLGAPPPEEMTISMQWNSSQIPAE